MNKNLKTVVESLHREIDIYQSQLLKPHSQFGGKKSRKKSRRKSREKSRRKNRRR